MKSRYEIPSVSIIIPVYNAEKYISETIESVRAQTYTDWEIIAVDDGSTDGSTKILKKYEQQLSQQFYVIVQQNSGVSVARNTAIKVSKGKYIAFLDHDDLWLPKKLEKQVDLLDSNMDLGMVYSDFYVINSSEKRIKKSILPYSLQRGNIFNELFYQNFIGLLTVIIRKDILDKVGLFSPKYEIAEEYDLFLRIAEHYPIDFVDLQLAKYRIHDGNDSKNIKLSVEEDLQIMRYWLDKKPDLWKVMRTKIIMKRIMLYKKMFKYYSMKK